MRTFLVSILAVTTLASVGCKKQQPAGEPAAKTAEGSAAQPAAGSVGAAGSATGAATPDPAKPTPPGEARSLLDAARAAGSFTTFLKAIDAGGLTEKLSGPGPFTVLAPTDDAFAKLPPKDLEALLADKSKLQALLQNHIVEGTVASKDLATQKSIKTAQGGELAIDASSGIKVGGATVVTPDIAASNGVIHAIDAVIVAPR